MEETRRTIKSIKRDGTIARGRVRAEIEALRLLKKGHTHTQHVVPGKEGGWEVKKGGADRATRHFETKQEAIAFAREVSRNQGRELIIHRKDGIIQRMDNFAE